MTCTQKLVGLTSNATVGLPRTGPQLQYHSGLVEYSASLGSNKIVELTISNHTDHRDEHQTEGEDVCESPEPESPSHEI